MTARPDRRKTQPARRGAKTNFHHFRDTTETRSLDDLGIEHEVRVVEAVARHVGAPVHLVGHSFGATVALAAALAGAVEVCSLTTFEANPIPLVRERGRVDLYESCSR